MLFFALIDANQKSTSSSDVATRLNGISYRIDVISMFLCLFATNISQQYELIIIFASFSSLYNPFCHSIPKIVAILRESAAQFVPAATQIRDEWATQTSPTSPPPALLARLIDVVDTLSSAVQEGAFPREAYSHVLVILEHSVKIVSLRVIIPKDYWSLMQHFVMRTCVLGEALHEQRTMRLLDRYANRYVLYVFLI